MKSSKNLGSMVIALSALLSTCKTNQFNAASKPASTLVDEATVALKPPTDSRPYVRIGWRRFKEYNPKTSAKTIEIKEAIILNAILNSLNCNIVATENLEVKDKDKFYVLVTNEAAIFGYDENRLKNLSIREAVELAYRITAKRLEYIGYFDKKPLEEKREKLESIISQQNIPEEVRCLIQDAAYEIKKAELHVDTMTEAILRYSGDLTKAAGVDKLPAEEVLQRGTYVVCRNYVKVTKAVFDTLREINPNLNNTYMSIWSNTSHAWNQVATVTSDEEGNLTLDVTFVDPTGYDLHGDAEALDYAHFDRYLKNLWLAVNNVYGNLQKYRKYEDKESASKP